MFGSTIGLKLLVKSLNIARFFIFNFRIEFASFLKATFLKVLFTFGHFFSMGKYKKKNVSHLIYKLEHKQNHKIVAHFYFPFKKQQTAPHHFDAVYLKNFDYTLNHSCEIFF